MIETSPAVEALAAALHAVQGQITGVLKDSRNPHFKTKYASLAAVLDTARPALQEAGLAVVQAPGPIHDGKLSLTTMILHGASGQWLRSTGQIALTKQGPQETGSAITYARRYGLMSLLGLPAVDDDAEEATERSTPEIKVTSGRQTVPDNPLPPPMPNPPLSLPPATDPLEKYPPGFEELGKKLGQCTSTGAILDFMKSKAVSDAQGSAAPEDWDKFYAMSREKYKTMEAAAKYSKASGRAA
jgi:hypothetical protein